jgi:hypothetical protein
MNNLLIKRSRFIFFLILLMLLVTGLQKVNAQTQTRVKPTDVSIVADPDHQKIVIEVSQGAEISNLLVLVVDDTGHTVFLDDKTSYKGTYRHQVDLKKEKRGTFDLKIIADKEEINKKVVMR